MHYIFATFFHTLPILPFYYGHYYLGMAMVLCIVMPYVKVAKARSALRSIEESHTNELRKQALVGQTADPSSVNVSYNEKTEHLIQLLKKNISFWKYFTFFV